MVVVMVPTRAPLFGPGTNTAKCQPLAIRRSNAARGTLSARLAYRSAASSATVPLGPPLAQRRWVVAHRKNRLVCTRKAGTQGTLFGRASTTLEITIRYTDTCIVCACLCLCVGLACVRVLCCGAYTRRDWRRLEAGHCLALAGGSGGTALQRGGALLP